MRRPHMRPYAPGTMVTLHPHIDNDREVAVLKPDSTLTTVPVGSRGVVIGTMPISEVGDTIETMYVVMLSDHGVFKVWFDKMRAVR